MFQKSTENRIAAISGYILNIPYYIIFTYPIQDPMKFFDGYLIPLGQDVATGFNSWSFTRWQSAPATAPGFCIEMPRSEWRNIGKTMAIV
jgi:hypothetical protein